MYTEEVEIRILIIQTAMMENEIKEHSSLNKITCRIPKTKCSHDRKI
jgi:hypothetical protein